MTLLLLLAAADDDVKSSGHDCVVVTPAPAASYTVSALATVIYSSLTVG